MFVHADACVGDVDFKLVFNFGYISKTSTYWTHFSQKNYHIDSAIFFCEFKSILINFIKNNLKARPIRIDDFLGVCLEELIDNIDLDSLIDLELAIEINNLIDSFF